MNPHAGTVASRYIHPYEVLGLDPDREPIDEKNVNRARKRALADAAIADPQDAPSRDDVLQASELLQGAEHREFFANLWNDEPLLQFLRSSELHWAKRMRDQDYYANGLWSALVASELTAAIRRAVRTCLADHQGSGVDAILALGTAGRLPASIDISEIISTECLADTNQLKTILHEVVDGLKKPDATLADDVAALINFRFYNALPERLTDLTNNAFANARRIAIACYNQCNESVIALAVLERIGNLTLSQSHRAQLAEDLDEIRPAADLQRSLAAHTPQLAEAVALCVHIEALTPDDKGLFTSVQSALERIEGLTRPMPEAVSVIVIDRCAGSLRFLSTTAWNKTRDYTTSTLLLERLLTLPCSEELKEMARKDLGDCCTIVSDEFADLLHMAKAKVDELQQLALTRRHHDIHWGNFNERFSKVTDVVLGSRAVSGLAPLLKHSPELRALAGSWIQSLHRLTCLTPARGPGFAETRDIARSHLSAYPAEWAAACALRDEIAVKRAATTKSDFTVLGVQIACVVAFILVVIGIDSIWPARRPARTTSYTPPPSHAPPSYPPPPSSAAPSTYIPPPPRQTDASLPSLALETSGNGPLVDANHIYEGLRREMIIDAIRSRVADDGIDAFNAYVTAFNASYGTYRYYPEAMATARLRIASDQTAIRAQAESILTRLNRGLPAE